MSWISGIVTVAVNTVAKAIEEDLVDFVHSMDEVFRTEHEVVKATDVGLEEYPVVEEVTQNEEDYVDQRMENIVEFDEEVQEVIITENPQDHIHTNVDQSEFKAPILVCCNIPNEFKVIDACYEWQKGWSFVSIKFASNVVVCFDTNTIIPSWENRKMVKLPYGIFRPYMAWLLEISVKDGLSLCIVRPGDVKEEVFYVPFEEWQLGSVKVAKQRGETLEQFEDYRLATDRMASRVIKCKLALGATEQSKINVCQDAMSVVQANRQHYALIHHKEFAELMHLSIEDSVFICMNSGTVLQEAAWAGDAFHRADVVRYALAHFPKVKPFAEKWAFMEYATKNMIMKEYIIDHLEELQVVAMSDKMAGTKFESAYFYSKKRGLLCEHYCNWVYIKFQKQGKLFEGSFNPYGNGQTETMCSGKLTQFYPIVNFESREFIYNSLDIINLGFFRNCVHSSDGPCYRCSFEEAVDSEGMTFALQDNDGTWHFFYITVPKIKFTMSVTPKQVFATRGKYKDDQLRHLISYCENSNLLDIFDSTKKQIREKTAIVLKQFVESKSKKICRNWFCCAKPKYWDIDVYMSRMLRIFLKRVGGDCSNQMFTIGSRSFQRMRRAIRGESQNGIDWDVFKNFVVAMWSGIGSFASTAHSALELTIKTMFGGLWKLLKPVLKKLWSFVRPLFVGVIKNKVMKLVLYALLTTIIVSILSSLGYYLSKKIIWFTRFVSDLVVTAFFKGKERLVRVKSTFEEVFFDEDQGVSHGGEDDPYSFFGAMFEMFSPSSLSVKEFKEMCMTFNHGKTTFKTLFDFAISIDMVKAFICWISGNPNVFGFEYKSQYRTLTENFVLLLSQYPEWRGQVCVDEDLVKKIFDLADDYQAQFLILNSTEFLTGAEKRVLSENNKRIQEMKAVAFLSQPKSTTRVEPTVIIGFGDPGSGKTRMLEFFAPLAYKYLQKYMKEWFGEEWEEWSPAQKWTKPERSEYYESYFGQKIHSWPEFANVKTVEGRSQVFSEFLLLVDSVRHMCNMATAELKGTVPYTTPMMMLTSNLTDITTNGMTDPTAVMRRMHFPVKVERGENIDLRNPSMSDLDKAWKITIMSNLADLSFSPYAPVGEIKFSELLRLYCSRVIQMYKERESRFNDFGVAAQDLDQMLPPNIDFKVRPSGEKRGMMNVTTIDPSTDDGVGMMLVRDEEEESSSAELFVPEFLGESQVIWETISKWWNGDSEELPEMVIPRLGVEADDAPWYVFAKLMEHYSTTDGSLNMILPKKFRFQLVEGMFEVSYYLKANHIPFANMPLEVENFKNNLCVPLYLKYGDHSRLAHWVKDVIVGGADTSPITCYKECVLASIRFKYTKHCHNDNPLFGETHYRNSRREGFEDFLYHHYDTSAWLNQESWGLINRKVATVGHFDPSLYYKIENFFREYGDIMAGLAGTCAFLGIAYWTTKKSMEVPAKVYVAQRFAESQGVGYEKRVKYLEKKKQTDPTMGVSHEGEIDKLPEIAATQYARLAKLESNKVYISFLNSNTQQKSFGKALMICSRVVWSCSHYRNVIGEPTHVAILTSREAIPVYEKLSNCVIHKLKGRDTELIMLPQMNCLRAFADIRGRLPKLEQLKARYPAKSVIKPVMRRDGHKELFVIGKVGGDLVEGNMKIEMCADSKVGSQPVITPVSCYMRLLSTPGVPGECMQVYNLFDPELGTVKEDILGVHIGKHGQDTIVEPLSQEEAYELTRGISQNGIFPCDISESEITLAEHPYIPGLQYVGTLNGSSFAPVESALELSLIVNELEKVGEDVDVEPALLRPVWVEQESGEFEKVDPLKVALAKFDRRGEEIVCGDTFDLIMVKKAKLLKHFFEGARPNNLVNWTIEQAVLGEPGVCSSLDRDTSASWIFQRARLSRKDLWDFDRKFIHPKLIVLVRLTIEQLKRGLVPFSFCVMCLKDELRDKDRVRKGKTRLFCVSSLVQVIVMKMYIGPVISYIKDHLLATTSSVGINPHCREWKDLYNLITKFDNYMAEDKERFDLGVLNIFAKVVGHYYCEWYKAMEGDEMWNILQGIGSMLTAPIMVIGSHMYMWPNGVPSGMWATSSFDTQVSECYVQTSWKALVPKSLKRKDHLVAALYGDDDSEGVSDEAGVYYDMLTRHEFFKKTFAINTTDPDKGELTRRFVKMEDMSFLGRKFVPFHRGGHEYILPKLDWSSIIGMLAYTRKSKDKTPAESISQNMETALRELVYYGKPEFEKWAKLFREWSIYYNLPYRPPFANWEDGFSAFVGTYYD